MKYLNMNTGLLFEQVGKRIIGKTTKWESVEFDHVQIDNEIFRLGTPSGGLYPLHKTDSKEFDDFDTQVQCEEVYAGS